MYKLLFFCLFPCIFFSCFGETDKNKPSGQNYDLSSPSGTYHLPKELKEVSGIRYVSNSNILCIEDEEGKIYSYNPQSDKIENIIEFGENGDYEGIARTEDAFFVLRSDGVLIRYKDLQTTTYNTPLSGKDNTESLCYDKEKNRLIIGSKDGKKNFYAFDLKSLSLIKSPLFTVNLKNIAPTDIDIHPITKEFYILSKEKIITLDQNGTFKKELALHASLFQQPEGISFKENGDLLISNEGGKGPAKILEFKYNQI